MSHTSEAPWGAPQQDGRLRSAIPAPEPSAALADLAYNLRWSWEPQVRHLFADLAPDVWEATVNPVAVLRSVLDSPGVLESRAADIQAAWRDLRNYLTQRPAAAPRVAYCCAEFALAECLPIYSGGLGVLAGDHLKAASDLRLPLVGVGLLYRYGYFRQVIDPEGWQRERYDRLDFESLPLRQATDPDGAPMRVPVPFPDREVWAQVWRAQVGRVPLYLLDTDLPENREDDRWITGHLYGGDQDTRIRQELVLGIGGGRLLQHVPAEQHPTVYHMNEGHSAFIALELARERLAGGAARSFAEALDEVAPRLIFTTHTPVAAGHDAFPSDLVEAYFSGYRGELGLSHAELMALGRHHPTEYGEGFSMTVLALRAAQRRNAVSQLHGEVSRLMWGDVGVGVGNSPAEVPMGAVTNGVHTATWAGPEMGKLFDRVLGRAWRDAPDAPASWERLAQAEMRAVWEARTAQRARLLRYIESRLHDGGRGRLAAGAGAEGTLVVGFARRFATYKRAALLLEDPDRLLRLLSDPLRPVVLVFAGKAHPRDEPGKALMHRIVEAGEDPRFQGRLVFLENYDVGLARLLVQGSDVWLNTPRRPLEASGTSGMKAALNGGQHLSELDGWWDEAYRPDLGWALGQGLPEELPMEDRDAAEGEQLVRLLESEVVPTFFDRDADGLPRDWLQRVVRSVSLLAPAFSTARMVSEYVERFYRPAGEGAPPAESPPPANVSAGLSG